MSDGPAEELEEGFVYALEITGTQDRRDLEALVLRIRRLAVEQGIAIEGIRVEPQPRGPGST